MNPKKDKAPKPASQNQMTAPDPNSPTSSSTAGKAAASDTDSLIPAKDKSPDDLEIMD